ncbi:helix-turn-helix domain-containing protein [Pseudochryseolinea flava]|uniref:XRE family transcriptional regulator n=1 Tax=Pseudochryseolinea flava TaxID=2059302 RepID=A0A364Y3Y5_9BACT|nr:helix-turn-helix transcriptional regulator [Pseudochryseolinea flava]RAW01567.1 XRE family transcriptional regulator [Pseudochryseolinea flava]
MKRDLRSVFGEVIRELRDARGLSQQELADYSETDRTYISDLERGLNYPSLNTVYKIAQVLEIMPHKLIEKVDKLYFSQTSVS